MGGPTFSFWYTEFTERRCAELESIIATVARSYVVQTGTGTHGDKRQRTLFDAELYVEAPEIACTGTIGVEVVRWPDDYYPSFIRAAFEHQLRAVPIFELGGYCMSNGSNDWDGLRLVATRVARAFGGWVVQRTSEHHLGPRHQTVDHLVDRGGGRRDAGRRCREIPDLGADASLLGQGVVEIVARDDVGYFGARIDDAEHVRAYREFVPEERYWLVDARLSPGGWVRK
jgi:hypothetical protein